MSKVGSLEEAGRTSKFRKINSKILKTFATRLWVLWMARIYSKVTENSTAPFEHHSVVGGKSYKMSLKYFTLVSLLLRVAQCANILMWMSVGSKSHFNSFAPLALSLAARNHKLDIVAPTENKKLEKHPNVRFV